MPPIAGKARRRYVYGPTKSEVRTRLAQLQVAVATGEKVKTHADRTTVAAYLMSWIAGIDNRPKTRAQYEWIVRDYLVPRIGSVRLDELDSEMLEAMRGKLRDDKVGDRTRQLCHDVLRIALNRAVRLKILRFSPLEQIARPRYERQEITPWTEDEAKRIIEAAYSDRFYALYAIELRLGLQFPGEVLALRWGHDVDMKRRVIRVGSQIVGGGRADRERSLTKTRARPRELTMPKMVYDALARHRQQQIAEGLRGSELVFPNRKGTLQSDRNFVRDSFDKVVRRAGDACRTCDRTEAAHVERSCAKGFEPCVRRVRPYDMRHTFATLALSAGVNIKVLAQMLGHANFVETVRTYAHFMPSMIGPATAAMDRLWDDSEGSKAAS